MEIEHEIGMWVHAYHMDEPWHRPPTPPGGVHMDPAMEAEIVEGVSKEIAELEGSASKKPRREAEAASAGTFVPVDLDTDADFEEEEDVTRHEARWAPSVSPTTSPLIPPAQVAAEGPGRRVVFPVLPEPAVLPALLVDESLDDVIRRRGRASFRAGTGSDQDEEGREAQRRKFTRTSDPALLGKGARRATAGEVASSGRGPSAKGDPAGDGASSAEGRGRSKGLS